MKERVADPMTAMYHQLLLRSGLSEQDAATLHKVSVEQVREWTRHRIKVPMSAITALQRHCRNGHDSADTPDATLELPTIAEVPEGYEIARIEMVVRLRRKR